MATPKNLIKFPTSSTSSPLTIGSATSGFRDPAAAGYADGDLVIYRIDNSGNWEIASGVLGGSLTTLTRTTLESSTGSALTLSGTSTISFSPMAEGNDLITLNYTTSPAKPRAPGAGKTTWFSRKRAGHGRPIIQPELGKIFELMPHLALSDAAIISPITNSASVTALGCAATISGGGTARAFSNSSFFTSLKRFGLTTVTTANAARSLIETTARYCRGGASDRGGFLIQIRFGVNVNITDGRLAIGLYAAWAGTNDPSNATDCFMIGKDSADTNLQIMHNDASGTATKVSLGASFPANTSATDVYDLTLFCEPGGSTMYYAVERLNTGDITEGSVNSNLPTAGTASFMVAANGIGATTGTAHQLDIMGMFGMGMTA